MRYATLALTVAILVLTLAAAPLVAQQPVGTLTVTSVTIPSTTAQLSQSFLGVLHEATGAEPYITVELQQIVSADANKTLVAGAPIATPLSNVYTQDNVFYIVEAANQTKTFVAAWEMNVTLGNHYIDPSWVSGLELTIVGNASITPNAAAYVYAYDFATSSWVLIGDLNSTAPKTITWKPATPSDYIDPSTGAIWLKFNFTDTTNTPFKAGVDYLAATVNYTMTLQVSSWATKQTNAITVGIDKYYTPEYETSFTVTAPVSGHQFGFKLVLPDASNVSVSDVLMDGSSIAFSASGGDVSFSATLGSASFTAKYSAPNALEATLSTVFNSNTCIDTLTIHNMLTELSVDNVTAVIEDWPQTLVVELHHEASSTAVYLDGSQVTPTKLEKGELVEVAVGSVSPGTTRTVEVHEVLPTVYVMLASNDVLDASMGTNEYHIKTADPVDVTLRIIDTSLQPFAVADDEVSIPFSFNGTHLSFHGSSDFVVYFYNPVQVKAEVDASNHPVLEITTPYKLTLELQFSNGGVFFVTAYKGTSRVTIPIVLDAPTTLYIFDNATGKRIAFFELQPHKPAAPPAAAVKPVAPGIPVPEWVVILIIAVLGIAALAYVYTRRY